MSSLTVFNFESQDVRFVGTAETPEWVAADIVKILYPDADKRNYSNYLSKVPVEWTGHKNVMTTSATQTMTTLYEPGLYCLIARSNSTLAVAFQKWMYEELLPSVRKTGKYSVTNDNETEYQPVESDFIKSCKQLKESQVVLGLSDDDPMYRKLMESLLTKEFGIEASAPMPKTIVKSEPKVKAEATIINSEAGAIARVKTIVQVIEKPVVSQSDEPVTLGKLTKWGNKIRNLCKADKQPYEDILETMAVLGYLENIGVNCRGAINYRLVKIPKNGDIAQIAKAVIA